MNLLQLFITWLIFGIAGVSMDLYRNQHEYKGVNLFTSFAYLVAFILGGPATFVIALHELIEDKKKKK